MINESYSLVLNSATSTNIINDTRLSSYQYNVNWKNILPQKYSKYIVTFQCKSDNATTVGFSGTINGTTLLVNSVFSGEMYVGLQFLYGNSPFQVHAFGSGNGDIGTYTISNANNVIVTTAVIFYSINSTFYNNVICSVNFGGNTTIDDHSSSNKIGTLHSNSYPLNAYITTSNLSCATSDNGPIQIMYPTNNNVNVRFTYVDGSEFTQMTDYNLQLYFQPIEENKLLSGGF
jgi:hypothetical protein